MILTQRKHWSTFVTPLIPLIIICTATLILPFISYFYFAQFFGLAIVSSFIISILTITIAIKSTADWYYNLYIITNRKISEVSYSPLASRRVSEILLTQVRCTEIDTKINGIFNELFNIGDVVITFDRPTHEEEFTLHDVKNPGRTEAFLEKMFFAQSLISGQAPEDDFYVRNKNFNIIFLLVSNKRV